MKTKRGFLTLAVIFVLSGLAFTASARNFLALFAGGNVVQTTLTSFAQLPDMGGSINVAGNNRCVTATFSAEVASGTTLDGLVFRALLDGSLMEGHFVDGFLAHTPGHASSYELVAYTFWRCGVSRGPHTVAVEWRSTDGFGIIARGRTLIVEGK